LTARSPEVTCVIPAFEQPDLLARCLASVAAQRDVRVEIIVADDSRDAAVRERVATLAIPAVRCLDGARSGNPVDNWNLGLAQARAPVCVLVHHDEFLIDPTYLRRAVDRLVDPGIAAVIGPTTVTGVDRRSRFAQASWIGRAAGRPTWILPTLNWIGPTGAFVFRHGPLFDRKLVQLVDVDFYRRVLATGRAAMLDGECVGSLGHHGAQITASIDPRRAAREEIARLAHGPELSFHRAVLRVRGWIG
jgi:glycosyltransferase involved in cell wall biosynthesis